MTTFSTCPVPTCAATVEGRVAACPKCGGAMRVMREGRVRGWLLLCLGLFLVVFMGGIAMTVGAPMLHPGKEIDGSTFTGTAEQARTVMLLFGAIILFGATTAAYGVFMIATGRQSRGFIVATFVLFAVLGFFAWSIMGWKS